MSKLYAVRTIVDGENRGTAYPHFRFTSVSLRQPEVSRLEVGVMNLGPFDPKGRIPGGFRIDFCNGIILCIDPDCSTIKELAIDAAFDLKNVELLVCGGFSPDQRKGVVLRC